MKKFITSTNKDGVIINNATAVVNHDFGWIMIERTGKTFIESVTVAGVTIPTYDYGVCPAPLKDYELILPNQIGDIIIPGYKADTGVKKNRYWVVKHKQPGDILRTVRAALGKIAQASKTEAVVLVFFNKETEQFEVRVPEKQKITGSSYKIEAEDFSKEISDMNKVLCGEYHSHPFGHNPAPFFSSTDEASKDKYEGRIYGNITFEKEGKRFGYFLCKLPQCGGSKEDFLDPGMFFSDMPDPNEEIDFDSYLTPELNESIQKVVDANKPVIPVYATGFYQGKGANTQHWGKAKNHGFNNHEREYFGFEKLDTFDDGPQKSYTNGNIPDESDKYVDLDTIPEHLLQNEDFITNLIQGHIEEFEKPRTKKERNKFYF